MATHGEKRWPPAGRFDGRLRGAFHGHRGAIVFVVLVEPGHYTTKRGFPWLTPTTSNRSVLAPVRLCKRPVASTLPLSVTGFRAIQRGATTVTARLAPGWPGSFKPGPEPSRNVVSVR